MLSCSSCYFDLANDEEEEEPLLIEAFLLD